MTRVTVQRLVLASMLLAAGGAGCGGGNASGGDDGGSGTTGAGGSSATGGAGQAGTGGRGTGGAAGAGGVAGAATGGGGASTGLAGDDGAAGAGGSDAGGADAPAQGVVGLAGGTIADASGAITIQIPAGALLGETAFSVSSGPSPPSSPDYSPIAGASFRMTWTGAGFTAGAKIGVHIQLPQTAALDLSGDGDLLASPSGTKVAVMDCPDGSTSTYVNASNQDGTYDSAALPVSCTPPSTDGGGGPGQLVISVVTVNPSAVVTITSQPAPGLACQIGQDVSLTVGATGAGPLTYQWFRKQGTQSGVPIPGATSRTYTGGFTASDDGTKFSVVVSNSYGSVTSDEASLSVLPPAPFAWAAAKPIVSSFAANVGAPAVASLGGFPVVVWNDGGALRGGSGSGVVAPLTSIGTLALPMRGQPALLGIDTGSVGYIVFVDDDGTGSCPAETGNRLSAVALGADDDGAFPLSDRVTLYPPAGVAGDCIAGFASGLADNELTSTDAADLQVVFALVEASTQRLRTGAAIAGFQLSSAPGLPPEGSWTWTVADDPPPALDPGCDGPAALSSDGIATPMQAHGRQSGTGIAAMVAWQAGGNVCSARLSVRSMAGQRAYWSNGAVVMDRAASAPVAAMDAFGNPLVVTSRAPDPAGSSTAYEITAAFQSSSATWSLQALDASTAPTNVSAVFDGDRYAYVAWRSSPPSGPSAISAAVRTPDLTTTSDGTWGAAAPISTAGAVGLGAPRLCASVGRGALALYAQSTDSAAPPQIAANRWSGGIWSLSAPLQADANTGDAPACAFAPNEAVWRETDPSHTGAPQIAETSAPEPATTQCLGQACALGTATIVDYPVPNAEPGSFAAITVGPDGNVWFTHDNPNFVGRIDALGTITEFPLDVLPVAIAPIVGGELWVTALGAGKVKLRALNTQGSVTVALDVPGSAPGAIGQGPAGDIWFGAGDGNLHILTPNSGALRAFASPNPGTIQMGPDGNVWFTDAYHLFSVMPAGTANMFTPPSTVDHGSWLGAVTVGPDHNLWFTERAGKTTDPEANRIGRLTLPSTIDEFKVCESPLAITGSPDGNVWYGTFTNKVGRITPSGKVTEFATHAAMENTEWGIASAGRDLWVVQQDGTIGRITAP